MKGPGMKGRGRKLFGITPDASTVPGEEGEPADSGPAARAEGLQRVQVGVLGIAAMMLLVGLASIIGSQADLADEAAVPDAAPTTEPTREPPPTNPLADAGVVPDIPADPSPAPLLDPLVLPPSVGASGGAGGGAGAAPRPSARPSGRPNP